MSRVVKEDCSTDLCTLFARHDELVVTAVYRGKIIGFQRETGE